MSKRLSRKTPRRPRHTSPLSFLPRRSFLAALSLSFGMLLVVTSGVLVAPAAAATLDGNLISGTCTQDCDADTDFFPDKIVIQRATSFDVAYEDHYKVLTLGDGGATTIVLTQCGCDRPDAALFPVNSTIFVDVPIDTAAVESTTYITFLELIDELPSVSVGPAESFVSSPCALAQYADDTTVTGTPNGGYSFDEDLLAERGVDVFFTFGASSADQVHIQVLETSETDPLGAAEWVEFFALFYNREADAKAYVDLSSARYECTSELALREAGSSRVPKVLWASNSDGGWFPAVDGAWYTDMISKAGGELLIYSLDGAELTCFGFFPCLTDQQLLDGGAADADVFIYTGFDWATYSSDPDNAAFLQSIKAVREDAVFDTQGLGSDWFESRLPEPDVVLEDLVVILQPDAISHTRVWLRHVSSEPIRSRGGADDCEPFELKANECDLVVEESITPDLGGSIGAAPALGSSLVMTLAVTLVTALALL